MQFSFRKNDASGSVYVQGKPGQGAEYAVLTLNLPVSVTSTPETGKTP
jgi:hypothetical protein